MNIHQAFEHSPTIFFFLSAVCWLISSLIKAPDRLTFTVTKPDIGPLGGNPLGGKYVGHATCPELEKNANRLRWQSRFNAFAAFFAAIAVALPSIGHFFGY